MPSDDRAGTRPVGERPPPDRLAADETPAPVPAATVLNILILEDVPSDAELMQHEMRKAGVKFIAKRVDRRADFMAALETFRPDVLLADCRLPDFSGAEALAHVRQHHPEIPVVMVAGLLGDEAAIKLLQAGARDYVLKDHLLRLPSAVERAVAIEEGIRSRKAAERALRAANEMLRATERIAHIGGWEWDIASGRLVWSEEMRRIFGRAPSEPEPSHAGFPELVHPDDRARLAQSIDASINRDEPFDAEFRILRPDRTERIIHTHGEIIRGEGGKAVRLSGTVQDITERQRAEEKLRESQQLLEGILNAIPVRVFWKDSNLVYLGCNSPFARDAGFADPADIVGKDDYQMAWREHADAYRRDDRSVIETGEAKPLIEEALTTPTAETLTILTSKTPLRALDGRIAGVLGTYQDITERRLAAQNLQASEERFRLVIEHAPDAILLYDFDQDRFITANRAAEQLFGCGRDEILKCGPQHFYSPEQPDRLPVEQSFAEHIRRAIAGERITCERHIRNAGGEDRLCQVTLVRLPSAGQRLLRASYVDVTDERRVQRELAEQVALLATEHELSPDAILVVDPAAKIISANHHFEEIFKVPAELMAAKDDAPVLDWVSRQIADQEGFLSRVRHLYEHPAESSRDEIALADGRVLDRFSTPVRQADGSYLGRVWFFREITDKIEAKRVLQRLNRALLTLSRGNEAVVHAASEHDLLEQMCRSIVEAGGYRAAWVGMVQQDAKNILKTAAAAGADVEYLEASHHVGFEDGEAGCRVCGSAICTGEPQTSQDLLAEPLLARWHGELKQHGFAAAAAFPLKLGAEVFAVLGIYASEADAFNPDEMKLLVELADDLAYGIRALRERTAGEALNERWHKSLEATIGAIGNTVEMRDEYTAGHQQRVAKLAVAIARDLHLPDHRVRGVYLAGIIHDVGKLTVPAEILSKPGRLSQLQYQLIQAHAEVGYEIVKGIDFPWPIAEMVRQHHERLDGSGYPRGLKGEAILTEAKILAVADVVEAMMSHRPYRPALGIEAALAEIAHGRGTAYDAATVDACIALFRKKGFTFD